MPLSSSKKRLLVILMMAIVYIINFEISVIMSLGPKLVETYGISTSDITYLFIGFSLMGVFAPFLGYLADKFGLKNTLILGVAFFLVGSTLTVFTRTPVAYFITRSIMGVGYYSLLSLTTSFLSSIVKYSKLGLVSGLHRFAIAGAFFSSPLIGAYLVSRYDFHMIYIFVAVVSFILLICLFFIPNVRSSESMELKNVKDVLVDKKAIMLIISVFGLTITSKYVFNYLGLHLSAISYNQATISSVYSFGAVGSILAGLIIILLSDKLGKVRVALFGITLSFLSVASLLLDQKFVVFLGFFLLGIGYDISWGLLFPVASNFYKKGKSTFLTGLTLATGLAGVFSNISAPYVNSKTGFAGNIMVSLIGLAVSGIAFYTAIKYNRKSFNLSYAVNKKS